MLKFIKNNRMNLNPYMYMYYFKLKCILPYDHLINMLAHMNSVLNFDEL